MAASWVLIRLADNKAVAETWDYRKVVALNTEKYKAVPIGEYLTDINRRIKNGKSV